MFRVLTVAREYGSGGGLIARSVAEKLGWNLLDKALVEAIAGSAQVDPNLARRYDERCDSWMHRVSRKGLWHGAFEGVAAPADAKVFDAETMALLGKSLILEAHSRGNCVIVGRGSQCVLQHKPDVYHAFVYAPIRDRIERLRKRLEKGADIEQRIRTVDGERAKYLQEYYGKSWCNIHLYDLMISSCEDEDATAKVILQGINSGQCAVDSGQS
jgi:cytidylate kinase